MVKLFQLKNSSLTVLSLLFAFVGSSQTKLKLEEYKAKYPGQHVILINHSNNVSITMIKGKPQLVNNFHSEFLVLDQNGILSLSEEMIGHGSFEELTINEAYVIVPKGDDKSEKIKVTQITTQDAEAEGSVFHDDTKETRLIFPRMEIGSLRVLDYSMVISEIKFPFGFNFGSYYPIEKTSFNVECDTNIHPVFRTYNLDDLKLNFQETVAKNKRTTSWSVSNPPTYKMETGAPDKNYFIPHVLGQIGYYNTKEGKVPVLNDLNDLHAWYFQNIKEVHNEAPNKEITTISDSITRNLSSEIEKVEAIYYWVQDNIKYIAFEEGVNGFIPRQPNAIIIKRYGDCKDMAALIYSMLKSVGIKSYLCWVGSRDLPYKYSEFASSICDNHMITLYKNNGQNYFLDATNSFLSYKEIASFTIGKEVFVNLDEKNFEILKMPIPEHTHTSFTDTTNITIDGKRIKGTATTYIGGYYNQYVHPSFHDLPKEKYDEVTGAIIQKGNNSCKITNAKIEDVYDRDKPIHLSYDYAVENYVTSLDKEVYLNMVLDKDLSYGELKKDRTIPFEFTHKSADSYTSVLAIPEGYTVKSIPKNVEYTSDLVDFSISYKKVDNKIIMDLKLNIKTIMIEPEQFPIWNQYITASKSALSQSLVLLKTN